MKGFDINKVGVITGLKNEENWTFREIFETYQKRIYFFVFSITKSDFVTEDILQEVFIKAWMNRETIDLSASFESFIYTIARNHISSDNDDVGVSEIMRRIQYPSLEADTNPEGLAGALALPEMQGGDNNATRVWWDKN